VPLQKVRGIHGKYNVVDFDPDILRLTGVVYSPFPGLPEEPWGIFDHGQKAVMPCRFWQGGAVPEAPGQALLTHLHYPLIEHEPSRQTYVYVGVFHEHYGHFLLSTFSRFWSQSLFADTGVKLLFHSDRDIGYWFAKPYIAALFAALGLGPDRFVRFDRPMRLAELIIPCPAFEETGFAHAAFARACNLIGARLAAPHLDAGYAGRPVYLSKSKVRKGVGSIVNEDDMVEVLSKYGVDVAHLETLEFAQQIALFHNREVVAGPTGSVLHTSIFAPGRSILGLCSVDSNFSSFMMLDSINKAEAEYVFPEGDMEELPDTGDFHNLFRLRSPARTAEEFVRLIDDRYRSIGTTRAGPPPPRATARKPNFKV